MKAQSSCEISRLVDTTISMRMMVVFVFNVLIFHNDYRLRQNKYQACMSRVGKASIYQPLAAGKENTPLPRKRK